jgi:hypothetical protein
MPSQASHLISLCAIDDPLALIPDRRPPRPGPSLASPNGLAAEKRDVRYAAAIHSALRCESGSHPNRSASPIVATHGRKQGNGGTREGWASIYSLETFREPPGYELGGSFSAAPQTRESEVRRPQR